MPKADNINTVIALISQERSDVNIGEYHTCKTIHCIGGWIEVAMGAYNPLDYNPNGQCTPDPMRADFLGITESDLDDLELGYSASFPLDDFDKLLTKDERKRAAIAHLVQIRDTGEVHWDLALESAGLTETLEHRSDHRDAPPASTHA